VQAQLDMATKSKPQRRAKRYPAMTAAALRAERAAQDERSRRTRQHPALKVFGPFIDLVLVVVALLGP
jgi:hypothetical protein